jgi:transcriptional regulator with XRE-family HTH domain
MEQLARLRELKGFSQRALAKQSGVSPATIYELENGRRKPNPSTLRKLASALDVEVADLLGADYPKEERRSSLEPSFNDVLAEERRLHYLKPWAGYVNILANNVERKIDQGHVTDLNWWQEFTRDVVVLTNLYNQMLPLPQEQTEDERLELLKLSEAIDRLDEVADKMDRAMEPIVAEMHKEKYARERERRKAALKIIHGRMSA